MIVPSQQWTVFTLGGRSWRRQTTISLVQLLYHSTATGDQAYFQPCIGLHLLRNLRPLLRNLAPAPVVSWKHRTTTATKR